MTERVKYRPFTGDTSKSPVLSGPPLAVVLCQIAWPELTELHVGFDSIASKFGNQLDGFPYLHHKEEIAYRISQEGSSREPGDKIYQWSDETNSWFINFGRKFLTFHANDYQGFADFDSRFAAVLKSLFDVLEIPRIERIGLRYINHVTDIDLVKNMDELLDPEVLGLAGISAIAPDVRLIGSINTAHWQVGSATVLVKTGILPPDDHVGDLDVTSDEHTWVMDIDASELVNTRCSIQEIREHLGKLADISVDLFRRMSNEKFLNLFEKREV